MGNSIQGIKSSPPTTIAKTHNPSAQEQLANNDQLNQNNPNLQQQNNFDQNEEEQLLTEQHDLIQQLQNQDDIIPLNPEYLENSRYAFVGQITQEAYECGISGLKVAGVGIGFSGGIGFNLPACFVAFCIGGTAGAVYGIVKGTYNVLTADSQSSTDLTPLRTEQSTSVKNAKARNLFGLFIPEKNDQTNTPTGAPTHTNPLSPALNNS